MNAAPRTKSRKRETAEILIALLVLGVARFFPDKEHPNGRSLPTTFGLARAFSCVTNVTIAPSGDFLVITNGGAATLTNPTVSLKTDSASGDFVFKSPGAIDAKHSLTLRANFFTRSDGLIFDLRTYRAKGIILQTDQGSYGRGDITHCKDGLSFIGRLSGMAPSVNTETNRPSQPDQLSDPK
jgi:hypothetical protein